jgi:hypothetical protein
VGDPAALAETGTWTSQIQFCSALAGIGNTWPESAIEFVLLLLEMGQREVVSQPHRIPQLNDDLNESHKWLNRSK